MAKRLKPFAWALNIDESSFSRLTKTDYTWLAKGYPGSIKNIIISGSLSLITAMSTTGCTYSAISSKTVNSYGFILVLKKLFKELKRREGIERGKALLILDNAPWHQAKWVLEHLDKEGISYIFIPPYTPELAPVELLFGFLKRRITRNRSEALNFRTKRGRRVIADELLAIDWETVKAMWSHLYSKIKDLLEEITQFI